MSALENKIAETAADCFWKQGYNCAEAVFIAGKQVFNMPEDISPGIASGFGGGVGGCGSLCGALSGCVLVIGLIFNRTDPGQKELYNKVRLATTRLLEQFQKEHGNIYCRELTGYDFRDPRQLRAFFSEAKNRHKCLNYVESAARTLARVLTEMNNYKE